jgi:hypothetical protein
MERVTIRCSNLFGLDDYIKPDLVLQLNLLKVHLKIKSFIDFQPIQDYQYSTLHTAH